MNAQSDSIAERPDPPKLVNNLSKEFPEFLSINEQKQLEQKLQIFANETSNQIVIVIVDDLAGYEAYDYATRLGHKWGVGQAKFDNGIVILIKPTGGEGKRDLFIAVGYGLEGAIPDLTTKQIRENEMYPYFKQGEYYIALDKATNVLMTLAKGEYYSDAYAKKNEKDTNVNFDNIVLVIIGIIYLIILLGRRNKSKGYTMRGDRNFSSSSSNGSSFNGDSSNDRGSSSDGGFSGFGGGSFGGGGSGGKW